jgi:hypothetical protein
VNTDINIDVGPDSDSTASKIVLQGSCQKKYFVILVYANAEDYDKDPASFIYNKAFLCQFSLDLTFQK